MNSGLLNIDRQIQAIDQVICKNLETLDASERGLMSQNILSQLRNLVEHVMLKIWNDPHEVENSYANICKAIDHAKSRGDLKFLRRFHDYLQIVASHYTLDEDNSQRLMLRYYEFLLNIKLLLKARYGIDVLHNLHKFPLNTDPGLKQYYEEIAAVLDTRSTPSLAVNNSDRYYIRTVKPFFVNEKVYYEVTFIPAYGGSSKFDRVIAFTSISLSGFYAAKLSLKEKRIQILGRSMAILVIDDWEVSIRPCEIDNFSRILGIRMTAARGPAAYRRIMRYLTVTGFNLVEIIDFNDADYEGLKNSLFKDEARSPFFDALDRCRSLTSSKSSGGNILRYLLLRLNNRIIKEQLERTTPNNLLSGLYLKNGCIPFDQMPFSASLINHNPKISDLFECISPEGRNPEFLARYVRNNTEIRGDIYTPTEDVEKFGNVSELVLAHNEKLWFGHTGRKIIESYKHLHISEYQENTLAALRYLKSHSASGIQNYTGSVDYWLNSKIHLVDCEEKKSALRLMFAQSKVALIYGPAGTGKSTLINHVSHLFSKNPKIYLANTNPAVDNLRRKVDASNTRFFTIAKFLANKNIDRTCDVLIIDECSTVSNKDIKSILTLPNIKLLLLVGDIYQIESIRFGNWFSAARSFIPQTSVFELSTPYRSNNKALLDLWKRVRNQEDTIVEHIAKCGYSCNLDTSIFELATKEEIILCLNYDGLYGINNINRLLQESNPSAAVSTGIHRYKVGDPVLFNESNRFAPLIYNNMKGRIVGLGVVDDQNTITFDIEINGAISGMDAEGYNFVLLDSSKNGNSVIRFTASSHRSTDEDDDDSASDVVPFQVAYAVSIHKAQGLEYESVKIVITDETDELITHNIFYTAITRAKSNLKIYWSPEVERRVLEKFKTKKSNKDIALLKLADPSLK